MMSVSRLQDSKETIPWKVFAAVAMGVVMATIDGSIVAVALPSIRVEFVADINMVKWVMSIYLLVITALLLPFGRLADIFGLKRVYMVGMALFTLASAGCALALDLELLIFSRALQGVGAAMIMACTPAIITATFPPASRGKGIGLVGTTVGFGLTAGPPLGGLLLALFGWRSLFLINLPVGIASIVYGQKVLPPLRFSERRQRFDYLGALLFGAACTLLIAGVGRLGEDVALAVSYLLPSLFAGVAFVLWQLRVAEPLVSMELFRRRGFSAALLASVLSFTSGFCVFFLMPFYLTEVRGFSPHKMGLWLAVMPLMVMTVAPLAGSLSDRIGYRTLSTLGLALRSAAFALFALSGVETPLALVLAGMVLFGLGNGSFMPPNASSIMGSVPPQKLGIAGGLTAVARNLGMALGIGVGGITFANVAANADVTAFIGGWEQAMWTACAICSVGVVVSALRGPDLKKTEAGPDAG
jgi:EmrB/QacA subfamily drug resistance transporter